MSNLTNRMFIHTKNFDNQWDAIGLDDNDLAELQATICTNPQGHPVIRGTGGVRKTRVSIGKKGKSGGVRVIYGDFPKHGLVYLLDAYPKSEKIDITPNERAFLKSAMKQIEKNLEGLP